MPPANTPPTAIGRLAEQHAADYFVSRGFTILDRNWRNRWCELDIVARHAGTVHFIEAKYRRSTTWGSGFDHISRDKSARLKRATLAWIQAHCYTGAYQIDVISLTGDPASPTIDHLENAISD